MVALDEWVALRGRETSWKCVRLRRRGRQGARAKLRSGAQVWGRSHRRKRRVPSVRETARWAEPRGGSA